MNRGKRLKEALEKVDRERQYTPSEAVQLNDNEPLGCRDTLALPIATARIHPHMPRRRKSMSPHRRVRHRGQGP